MVIVRERESIVAPLAGARIETYGVANIFTQGIVAPLAGARIETRVGRLRLDNLTRRSPRGSAN